VILLVLGLVFYSNTGPQPAETPTASPIPTLGNQPSNESTLMGSTIAVATSANFQAITAVVTNAGLPDTPAPSSSNPDMVSVPAGSFTMGSAGGDTSEQPPHSVNVSLFYIDKYEVTNALYKKCVDAGSCQAPISPSSATRSSYYGNPQYDDYPVIDVNWNMAETYCTWQGGRLPTEAEWEKAARGLDGRTYPWGEGISCANANFKDCNSDTTKVGAYVSARSPFGLYDMAGNVWEWVNDWYQANYYSLVGNGITDPQGPASGDGRVIRGGSWMNSGKSLRSTIRNYSDPSKSYPYVGFRCASSNP
jgi:formylglycine-generating enzyme required for sulfatase activity